VYAYFKFYVTPKMSSRTLDIATYVFSFFLHTDCRSCCGRLLCNGKNPRENT